MKTLIFIVDKPLNMLRTDSKYFCIHLLTSLLLLGVAPCYANINSIDFKKVSYPSTLEPSVNFLKENLNLYDHWVHSWTAETKKETVVQNLSALYDGIDKIQDKSVDAYLLLGDIAHYLYNLELEPYYQKAIDNYKLAMKLSPDDYRAYWFLANHYALSDQAITAIKTYQKSLGYPLAKTNSFFWFDYSAACLTAGMRSTSLFALERSNEIQYRPHLQELIGQLKLTIITPKPDTTMEPKDIWSTVGRVDNKIIFENRVIGTRVAIDSLWGFQPGGFTKEIGYMTFKPTTIKSKVNNQNIDYSILVLSQIPKQGQSLKDFLLSYTSNYSDKQPIDMAKQYKNSIGYEIREPGVYKNIGGAHIYALAIERDEPAHPGMSLEAVQEITDKDPGKIRYLRVTNQFTRLKGKIYYLVLLDTCNYIHDESLAVFNDFLKNGLVIE